MRTTITIPDELLEQTLKMSGKKYYSEAIVTSLQAYLALRQRLDFLDFLFSKKVPHRQKDIKKKRKLRKWSS